MLWSVVQTHQTYRGNNITSHVPGVLILQPLYFSYTDLLLYSRYSSQRTLTRKRRKVKKRLKLIARRLASPPIPSPASHSLLSSTPSLVQRNPACFVPPNEVGGPPYEVGVG